MAIQRRAAAAAAAAPVGVNFGSLDFYVAGGSVPEGDYVWSDLNVVMFQAKDQKGVSKGAARLGVMITMYPLHDPKEENKREQFYSMGSNADKSFAPNAETGKGLVAIPGGNGQNLPNSTNWAILHKSLHDSGLPEGIFTNDLSVLEGVHVHMTNVAEPEERKGFANKNATGEAAPQQEERRANTIAVVSEIKDDGKPWEGTGGFPEVKAATAAKPVAGRPAVKPAARPAAVVVPIAAAAAEPASDDTETAAINAITKVLEAKPDGCSKLILKTSTFKEVEKADGNEVAQAVQETFFADDETLNAILGQLGYNVAGGMVKPLA